MAKSPFYFDGKMLRSAANLSVLQPDKQDLQTCKIKLLYTQCVLLD